MKVLKITNEQSAMVEKAIRFCISDLQCQRQQAVEHACSGSAYDEEIQAMRDLKQLFV